MRKRILPFLAIATLAAVSLGLDVQPPPLDLIVRGGTVIDGSGGRRFRADVGVLGDRIVAIGDLSARKSTEVLDASGLMVTPGFINLHSHAEARGLQTADNMLSQGVTTEILNADGSSPLNIRQQLKSLDSSGIALNVGAAVGFNSVWASVMGQTDRRPNAEEMARMQGLIRSNLEWGAFAVSSGLDYKPGFFATEDEVVQVVSPARVWRTNFPNHDRVLPQTGYSARSAVQETMRIGERAGLVPVITHMKVSGRERTKGQVVLGEMASYSARGVYVGADVYPYLSGMTGLSSLIIPGWAMNGGPVEMRKRFADPETRKRIITEADETIAGRFTGPDGILILSSRRYLSDYMKEFGTTSPAEAVVRILETSDERTILGFGEESDLVKILQYPGAAVSCDCGATSQPTGHPRNFGTFPRVLGRYVREQKHLTWENAIRKMTALPATMVGMIDRGYIAPGMHADLTVFDTATVIDRATFQEPGLMSEGIRHVVVNGKVAWRDGKTTTTRAGRAMYRHSFMPSRPMTSATSARRWNARGLAQPITDGAMPLRITVDVRQAAGSRTATGTITLRSPDGKEAANSSTLGVLQTAPGWWSISGRLARPSTGDERSFTLTMEAADPHVEGTPRTITLWLDGDSPVRARFTP